MSMAKAFISAMAIIGLLVFFQNCQRAKMSTSGIEQSSLTGLGASSTDLNNFDNNPPPNDPGNPDDDDDDDLAGNPDGDDNDGDHNNGHNCSKDRNQHEMGDREYVCVIQGPGNSTHIGIIGNTLEAKHEGPKMLCMTKAACEVEGARAFKNPHAEIRGFCKNRHNKNVKHISDANMKLLVDKYIAANPNGPQSTGHNNDNKN